MLDRLKSIKDYIECMDKYHQIEILKILMEEDGVVINENNNGSFVNLSEINETVLVKLEDYVDYVQKQQLHLLTIEQHKTSLENNFFKENKDNVLFTSNDR